MPQRRAGASLLPQPGSGEMTVRIRNDSAILAPCLASLLERALRGMERSFQVCFSRSLGASLISSSMSSGSGSYLGLTLRWSRLAGGILRLADDIVRLEKRAF